MERSQTLANLWIILKTISWIVMLEGVLEYYSFRHYNSLFRQLLLLILDHDPAQPRPPDNWEEWYNS